jgi:hypothetical protein
MKDKLYSKVNDSFHSLGECIMDKLQVNNGEEIDVKYSRTLGSFNISKNDPEASFKVPISHSNTCPMHRVQSELGMTQVIPKQVPVFSSLILKSSDQKVLLMRQTETLGLASKSWGFSYRKMQLKESLFKGGIRALREDAGINIVESGNSAYFFDIPLEIKPLCLYESIFPKILEHGLPRNQALIMFSEVYLPFEAEEIKVKRNNVDFLVWLDKEDFNDIQEGRKVYLSPTDSSVKLDHKCFKGIAPNKVGEGISEGHLNALVLAFNSEG